MCKNKKDQAFFGPHCRIRKYVRQQRTKRQKLEEIDRFVSHEFNQARNKCLPIHDSDLRRISIKKAREMNLQNFVASPFWLLNFKRRHHITSRKVAKLATKITLKIGTK